eukprot:scaffold159419_cov35-Tisochrysis_lutea.AAC.1
MAGGGRKGDTAWHRHARANRHSSAVIETKLATSRLAGALRREAAEAERRSTHASQPTLPRPQTVAVMGMSRTRPRKQASRPQWARMSGITFENMLWNPLRFGIAKTGR